MLNKKFAEHEKRNILIPLCIHFTNVLYLLCVEFQENDNGLNLRINNVNVKVVWLQNIFLLP